MGGQERQQRDPCPKRPVPEREHAAGEHHAPHHPTHTPPAGIDAEDQVDEGGQEEQGDQHGTGERKGLGEGQRTEQLALSGFQGEYRDEADDGGGNRGHDGRGHLDRGLLDGATQVLDHPLLTQVAHHVLREDDAQVHHGADGDHDAGERYDVGVHLEIAHGDEDQEHRQGQQGGDDQGAAELGHHDQDHDDGDEHLQ